FDRQMVDGNKMRTLLLTCVALVAVAILAAGCGSSSGGSSTGSGGGSSTGSGGGDEGSSEVAKFEEELETGYKGTSTEPGGGPVKTSPGKKVWVISSGLSAEAGQLSTKVIEEVGKKLGWSITVFDGKFEASRETTGAEQAVAAGAEGIILDYI